MPKRVGAEISAWFVIYVSSAQKFVNMEHDERYVWH